MSPSKPGWFPLLGTMPETQPDPTPQLNAVVHNELTELGSLFGQLQAQSPILPPEEVSMEQNAHESDGE